MGKSLPDCTPIAYCPFPIAYPMTPDQLRTALRELNGQRDLSIAFEGLYPAGVGTNNNALLDIHNAMLIPDEPDHLVKVTDGKSVFIIDAERVAWIKIGIK